MEYKLIQNELTPQEFLTLRNTTDWDELDLETIKIGINNSLYSVTIYSAGELIGMGRVIGDGSIYFYIQDVIVKPKFRSKGFGTIIMDSIMKYIDTCSKENSFIGLMAAEGVEKFYTKYGFQSRLSTKPGMYQIINKDK